MCRRKTERQRPRNFFVEKKKWIEDFESNISETGQAEGEDD
jgi:hypothetical protein